MLNTALPIFPLPPLVGGHNFRDLGGHSTRDGYRVAEGRLYRSGVMAGLNAQDIAALLPLQIRSIFDLRTSSERTSHPTPWAALGVESYDHGHDDRLSGDLLALLKDGTTTPENVRTVMLELYRRLPFDHAPSYRAIMLRIAAGQLPLVFHCSAGKDRTGALAALILALLGVAEADIMQDYLVTNDVDHRASVLFDRSRASERWNFSEALLAPVFRADPEYLDAMFAAIDDRAGGVHGFFSEVLGLDQRQIASIRGALLTPQGAVS